MSKDNPMQYHLAFSADNNYMPYLFTLCQSILDHIEPLDTNKQDELVFNVLTDSSVELNEIKLKAQSFIERNQSCGISHKFNWHVINADCFGSFSKDIQSLHVAQSTYYRLVIEKIFSADVERIAYLDIDMLVLDDIRKLFKSTPLHNKVLGAVHDPGVNNGDLVDRGRDTCIYAEYKDKASQKISISKNTYFNAGLLLVNLVEWRRQNIGQKCLELAAKLKVKYHDQDLLNIVCLNQVEFISCTWNYQNPMFYVLYNKHTNKYDVLSAATPDIHWQCDTPAPEEFEAISASPSIVHFTGLKPWVSGDKYYCAMPFGPKVPPSARLLSFREQWLAINQRVNEFAQVHTLNVDSINIDAINLYKINSKRKRDRDIFIYLISLSIILNCIALIKIFLF